MEWNERKRLVYKPREKNGRKKIWEYHVDWGYGFQKEQRSKGKGVVKGVKQSQLKHQQLKCFQHDHLQLQPIQQLQLDQNSRKHLQSHG